MIVAITRRLALGYVVATAFRRANLRCTNVAVVTIRGAQAVGDEIAASRSGANIRRANVPIITIPRRDAKWGVLAAPVRRTGVVRAVVTIIAIHRRDALGRVLTATAQPTNIGRTNILVVAVRRGLTVGQVFATSRRTTNVGRTLVAVVAIAVKNTFGCIFAAPADARITRADVSVVAVNPAHAKRRILTTTRSQTDIRRAGVIVIAVRGGETYRKILATTVHGARVNRARIVVVAVDVSLADQIVAAHTLETGIGGTRIGVITVRNDRIRTRRGRKVADGAARRPAVAQILPDKKDRIRQVGAIAGLNHVRVLQKLHATRYDVPGQPRPRQSRRSQRAGKHAIRTSRRITHPADTICAKRIAENLDNRKIAHQRHPNGSGRGVDLVKGLLDHQRIFEVVEKNSRRAALGGFTFASKHTPLGRAQTMFRNQ